MFPLASLSILLLITSFQTSESITGPHIADVNLLLPPRMTHPVEYRLLGSDGCFKWSWDHHDILSVKPEYNGSNSRCSTSARLISIARYAGRKETAVYAADLGTGVVIRVKVFIDNVSRVQIFHNSVKLDLDGLSTLRVRAFDAEENVFSSLVGLQFMWQLTPENGGTHRLVHVPLSESPLNDCGGSCGDLDIQIKLENSGVFSDLIVVKGAEIGHEIVSVNLVEPSFEHLADEIVLTVAEAMSIYPRSPVFVIVGALVRYNLNVIRQNSPKVINLPSPHHRWSALNSSVAQVDSQLGVTNALMLGITTITLEDTRVAGHVQMSSLHVVLPETLTLYKLPITALDEPIEGIQTESSVDRWYIIAGQQYVIHLKIFSCGPGAREIYITESDDVKLQYESTYWETVTVEDDIADKLGWQSSRILKAVSHGLGRLTASLAYHSALPDSVEVLKVVQEVTVCSQVRLATGQLMDPSENIHLPWAPGVYQELELRATGGCGETYTDYKWYSSDMATVSISASGVLQAKKPGQVTVKVVSVFDPKNYDEVIVKVSIPSSLVMLQGYAVETVVGTHLQAAVTLKSSDGSYFSRCNSFNSFVKWKSGSESFIIANTTGDALSFKNVQDVNGSKSINNPPCTWTYVYASSVGRALLHATLFKELPSSVHRSEGPRYLKASSRIAAYHPLAVEQVGNGNQFGGYGIGMPIENLNELFLAPRTELDLRLTGGPELWGADVEFIENIVIFDEEHRTSTDEVRVDQATTSSGEEYFRILCLTLGSFHLVFSRGNLVGEDHPLPAIEKVDLSLTCIFPSSIALITNEPVNTPDIIRSAVQADRSPGRVHTTPITVANGCTIRVAVVGIHNSGKAFANSSSLSLKWELMNCKGLADWNANDLERSGTSWERFLNLENASGLCIVRATVNGFSYTTNSNLYEKASSLLEKAEHALTDSVRLQLVSPLRVIPEFSLLFFSPEAKVNLSITGGTCLLDAVVNDTRVVEVIPPPPSLQCFTLMLCSRGLGSALVTVHDIGPVPPLLASAVVQVADLDWIRIMSQEEISLMEGSETSVDILAGIRDGSVFDSSQYGYMDIHLHFEDPMLELVNMRVSSPGDNDINQPSLVIRAINLGVTSLYVSARQRSGHEILSQSIKVEVYASPRMHPDDIFLVPGATYVLTLKGGPKVGVHVEYDSMDDGAASIDRSSGRLSAITPGNTTVRAMIYGNGHILICQAIGRVRVGVPSSMLLSLQNEHLNVGREMPIFLSLAEGNLFSFYELCKNYKWIIEDEQVLGFNNLRYLQGAKGTNSLSYSEESELGFLALVYGRSAGRTNIVVSFSCDFISSGTFSQSMSYNVTASLWVVSHPPLSLGVPITWVLPPFYTTSNLLPASSDSYSQLDSYSRKGTIAYSILGKYSKKNEDLLLDVISVNGGRIKTTGSNNLGCIQAKDLTTGRTEIASCVRVAEVDQIRVTTKELSSCVIELAVGAKYELEVNFCDSLGNPFHEAYDVIQFDVETNYPDVVYINGTSDKAGNIHIKARSIGRALIRISIANSPEKSDYIMISVGAHLYPQNPILYVGHFLNFSVEGVGDPVIGQWLSANQSVLSLGMQSGEGHAIEEGTTQVIYKSPSLNLQTTVTVLRVDIVSVDSPAETLTNVPFPTNGFYFFVRFSDIYNQDSEPNWNKGVLYDCTVDPPFVGYTKPWRDMNTGNSFCIFFPYSPEHLAHSIPMSKAIKPEMLVSINASLRKEEHVMGSSISLFVGGFTVLEMSKDFVQLLLTRKSNTSFVTVVGNTDVEIRWKHRGLMLVSLIRRDDFGIGGRAEYEVKVLVAEKFQDKIIISLPANGQIVELGVSYDPGRPEPTSHTKAAFWMLAMFSGLILMIVIVYVIVAKYDKPTRSSQPFPRVPTTPTTVTPITPNHCSGSSGYSTQQSPQTPQPFIDYVRRTVDETPYYKRGGRRRIVPQSTY